MKKYIISAAVFFLAETYLLAQQTPKLGENSIDDVMKVMTLDEKINLLKGIGMSVASTEDGPIAGVIDGKVKGAAGGTEEIERLGIPRIIVADGPAGLRIEPVKKGTKLNYTTAFPIGTAIASTWNIDLAYQLGKAMGNEVHEYGVDILLAPGINIQRDLLCGRNFEYYSEDPLVTGNIAAGFINGIQSNNVGTSIKHFAANNQETNRNSISAVISQRALREIYLKGFEIAIKKSAPWTVMSSYNKINGTYSSENFDLLTTVLRDEWKYGGVVMTDWYAGKDYPKQVYAGNDLLMPGRKQEFRKIKEAVENGTLPLESIDRNVHRILELIVKTPSFKNYKYTNEPNNKENSEISRMTASEGMILLKNNSVLPFVSKKIAILGNASYDTFVGGSGSGEVKTEHNISFEQGLADAGFQYDQNLKSQYISFIAKEKTTRPKRMSILEAIKPVEEMDISTTQLENLAQNNESALITIGRNAGEGSDRKIDIDYKLSEKELNLIKTTADAFHKKNKKVVVALNIDAVVDVASWRDIVDGILITWLPGQEAGLAFADIVSGKTSPSGHLAQSIPLKYSDSPSSSSFPGNPTDKPKISIYNEDIYVGYRYYSTFNKPVAYEFGYGLSYTTFKINKIKTSTKDFIEKIKVEVNVTNTGKTKGKEVVQLYLSAPGKTLEKPTIELKAFKKTKLLHPNKSEKILFELIPSDLASFDSNRTAWVVEPGIYKINIGNSSKNIQQTATFKIEKEIIVEKVHNVLNPQDKIEELKK